MSKAPAPCPICEKPLPSGSQNAHKPFCSARCKDVDLNRWLSGGYFIPGNQAGDDSEAVPEIALTNDLVEDLPQGKKTKH